MKWDKKTKEKINYAIAALSFLFGLTLTAVGFAVEPVGEIHSSVLTMLGICMTFTGSVMGISLHYSNELQIFKDEVLSAVNKKTKDK